MYRGFAAFGLINVTPCTAKMEGGEAQPVRVKDVVITTPSVIERGVASARALLFFLFSFSSIGILHKGKNVVCMSRLMRICILSAKRSQIMQRRCAVCNVQSKNLRLFSNPGFALKLFLLGGGSPQILTIWG